MDNNDNDSDNKADELIKFIPTIQYFDKMYGVGMEGNDQKAVKIFKTYEPQEKIRRLQGELLAVKKSRVAPHICDNFIGKKRRHKHGSYEHWAELMLQWIAQKKL